MTMIRIRKEHAGDAAGRTDGKPWSYDWPQDGAVVEVPYEVALELLAIPHGGFTAAETESADPAPGDGGPQAEDETAIEEPAAEAPLSESPPARPAKKAAAKKAAAPAPVEE